MSAPRLLIFDLDGTLIDSSLDLCNSVNAMLEYMGKETLPNSVIASYIGDGAAMLVRRALGDPGDLDSSASDETTLRTAIDYFLGWYREHKLDNTLPYPGVLEALREIRDKQPEMLMAVLTNKPVNPSRAICDALELAPFFFQNYGGNSFPSKKPDSEGFLTLIAEANAILAERGQSPLQPDEVVMIGDSDVDIITGRRCGARTIGCTFGINPAAMIAASPDALAHQASDWVELVGRQ